MKKTRPRMKRIPRPILAMAAPPPDHPVVSIDRLKGGEINWSLRIPGASAAAAITKAMGEAKRLIEGCMALEEAEREVRAKGKALAAALLAESQEKKKTGEDAGK
jgi:hypothetical protein